MTVLAQVGSSKVSEVVWLYAPEPWAIFLIICGLLGFSSLIYWLQIGSGSGAGRKAGRFAMLAMRMTALVLVLAVLLQPVRSTVVSEDKDSYVVMLVDTSMSMTFKDRYGDQALLRGIAKAADIEPGRVEDVTRLDLVKRAIDRDDGAFLDGLRRKNRVRVYSFGSERRPLDELRKVRGDDTTRPTRGSEADTSSDEALPSNADDAPPAVALEQCLERIHALEADGRETALGEAIVRVLSDLRSERLAALVVFSDGCNNVRTVSPEKAARRCRRRAPESVPVLPVLVGNPAEPKDVALDQLQAPDVAIAGDILNFDFVISQQGYSDRTASVELLFDDLVVHTEVVHFEAGREDYARRLQYKPERPGEYSVTIRIPELPDELTKENNTLEHRLRVIDQKIRVLYVEGYPRWEYRYLKNALIREKTMEVQCLLLSADPGFIQESTRGVPPVYEFPPSREELFKYHVIIFGDVDPGALDATGRPFFHDDALKWTKEFVEDFGGGFMMISGETDSPSRYAGTPIADILPIVIDENPAPVRTPVWDVAFRPRLTREGLTHPMMRLEQDEQRNLALWEASGPHGEAGALPGFYWFYRSLKTKPAARVLTYHPDERNQFGPYPILTTMPYKSGTVFFSASDETWRWRAGVGDRYFYRFWGQAVRYLAHGRFQRSKRFALTADRSKYFLGDDVRLSATVLDEHLQPYVPRLDHDGNLVDPRQAPKVEVESPDQEQATVILAPVSGKPGRFDGLYRPTRTGVFKARLLPPGAVSAEEDTPLRLFEVRLPSVELQEPRANQETLASMAETTGGELFTLATLDTLSDRIQPIIETMPIDSSEENLWDRQWVILLLVGLLGVEWLLRRVFRLP